MQLTKKSVPQIAKIMGFSEARVRAELSHLKLSILREFERDGRLAQARARFDAGQTVETIARALGFGVEALRFILHYERELKRGSSWTAAEVRKLRQLHGQGLTYSAITLELNRVSGLTPTDALYRTEGAVAAKIDALDLSVRRVGVFPPTVDIPSYGQVKRNGHLTAAAQNYIRDHYLDSLASVANVLGVQPESLEKFIRRHDLVFRDLPPPSGGAVGNAPVAPALPLSFGGPTTSAATLAAAPTPSSAGGAPDRKALHATPVVDRKDQARELLGAQEAARRARPAEENPKPLILTRLKRDQPLHELSLAELGDLLREAADQMGGVKSVSTNQARRPLCAKDSSDTFVLGTLLRAWAIKQWKVENPDKAPLNSNQVTTKELGGKTGGEWLAQWKETQGEVNPLGENTIVLSGLAKDADLSDLSAGELSALLREAADQMGGAKNVSTSQTNRLLIAKGSSETFVFNTLLRAWAMKLWKMENPDKPALNSGQITKKEQGGKTSGEWLAQWKESQGDVDELSEDTIVLSGLAKDADLSDLSAAELSALLKEAAEQMGGVKSVSTGEGTLAHPLAATGSSETFTFRALLTLWAMKQWKIENPDKPALNTKQILKKELGGKTTGEWIAQWKLAQGVVDVLSDNTIVLKGLAKDATLSALGVGELSALVKEAADQMGGAKGLTSGPGTMERPLVAAGSTKTVKFRVLFTAWAIKHWKTENPDKPALNSQQIFKKQEGGKTHAEWIACWRASQPE